MPLSEGAPALIRANLEQLQNGQRAPLVAIGTLTDEQLDAINEDRRAHGHTPIVAEILFIGRHIYKSRIVGDGYTIDEVIDQITNAVSAGAVPIATAYMTALECPLPRRDCEGNMVRDRAIFECSARHPKPELYSVVPKGDGRKEKGPPTK